MNATATLRSPATLRHELFVNAASRVVTPFDSAEFAALDARKVELVEAIQASLAAGLV